MIDPKSLRIGNYLAGVPLAAVKFNRGVGYEHEPHPSEIGLEVENETIKP